MLQLGNRSGLFNLYPISYFAAILDVMDVVFVTLADVVLVGWVHLLTSDLNHNRFVRFIGNHLADESFTNDHFVFSSDAWVAWVVFDLAAEEVFLLLALGFVEGFLAATGFAPDAFFSVLGSACFVWD